MPGDRTRGRWRARLATSALIAFLMVMDGCTEAVDRPGGSTKPRSEAQEVVSSQLSRLLNPPSILARAEQLDVARCLNSRDMPYGSRVHAPDGHSRLTLVGRPLSVERARRVGYGSVPLPRREGSGSGVSVSMSVQTLRALEPATARQVRVLLPGHYVARAARRGCLARARRRIYGSVRNFLLLWYGPQVIRLRLLDELNRALGEPEVQRAGQVYAACMDAAGYRTASPRSTWLRARKKYGADRGVTRAERRMAVWDARCQRRSAIYDTISARLIELGWPFLRRNEAFIGSLLHILGRAVSRARRSLEQGDRNAALGRRGA